MKTYFVYIIKCSDESYYTGVTSNLEKRIEEHNNGKYKGYTKKRIPVKLVYSSNFSDVNEAIRAEKKIKSWSRKKKEALINNDFSLLKELAVCKNNTNHILFNK